MQMSDNVWFWIKLPKALLPARRGCSLGPKVAVRKQWPWSPLRVCQGVTKRKPLCDATPAQGKSQGSARGAEQELKFSSVETQQEWLHLSMENLQAGSWNCMDISNVEAASGKQSILVPPQVRSPAVCI